MNSDTLVSKPVANWTWCYNSILCSESLSFKAKGLWCYINSKPLGWQFASARIAEETSDGVSSVRAGLNELVKAGLLRITKHKDGRISYALLDPKCENPTVAKNHCGKTALINKKEIDNNKLLSMAHEPSDDVNKIVEKSEDDKRNPDINELLDYWQKTFGYPIKSNMGKNRQACWNLLRRKDVGKERLMQILDDMKLGNQFPPQCSDYCDVQSKWNKIESWQQRLNPVQKSRPFYKPASEVVEDYNITDEDREATAKKMKDFKKNFFGK